MVALLHLLGGIIEGVVLHGVSKGRIQRERDLDWMQPAPHCNSSNTLNRDSLHAVSILSHLNLSHSFPLL